MSLNSDARSEWKAGWPLPFVAAAGVAVVNMPHATLGLFFEPLERTFGWTRAQSSSGILAFSAVAIFSVPIIGKLIDRFGPRRIALPGVVFFSAMFGMLGFAQSAIWTWWALWILLALAAACVSPVAWTAAVASRFDKARGLAMAITLSGAGIGLAAAPLAANWLIEPYGWRTAYLALGAIFCSILLPLTYFLFYGATDRHVPSLAVAASGPAPEIAGDSFREAIRSAKFIRLVIGTFLIAMGLFAMVVHFVPILTSAGIQTDTAAEAAAFIGAGSVVGRFVAGYLLDRMSPTFVGFGAFMLPAAVAFLLAFWGGDPRFVFALAFLLGLSLGSEVDVVAFLTSRHVGMKNFGSLFGICISAMALGVGTGPWAAGLIYDILGSYKLILWTTIPVFITAALLIVSLGSRPKY